MVAALALVLASLSASFSTAGDSRLAALGASASWTKVPNPGGATPGATLFLGGTDDCNAPHEFIGTGEVAGVPFSTGTTGSEGQNEGLCLFFGSTAIDGDVWFEWTADEDGEARLSTCGTTSVDTKVAIWPDASPGLCPPDGLALACNDDDCGLQTGVEWSVVQATTYTIQLGTFPGASGGSGTFEISIEPPPTCGQYDEANSPTALGLTTGGETGWLHYYDCMQVVHTVSTSYGDVTFPGSVTNGNHSWILVYEDGSCDVDPTTDLTLRASIDTVVMNGNTEILNSHPIGPVSVSGCFWVGASADNAPGEFPAEMRIPSTPAAWVVGSTLGFGTLNIEDLNANDVAPLQMNAIGFPCSWRLRAEGSTGPGVSYCFGAATPTSCPCGNVPDPGAGCGNGTFPEGALLLGSGDVAPDSIALLVARATPSQPGLFFQGDSRVNGGLGIQFGDGLRCAGGGVVRLEVVVADADGFATSTVGISAEGGVLPGETKRYQFWYRDPQLSPCGSGFNLTNGYEITW